MCPLPPMGETRLTFGLLALTWPSLGYSRSLGSEPTGRSALYLSLPFKQDEMTFFVLFCFTNAQSGNTSQTLDNSMLCVRLGGLLDQI